MRKSDAVVPPRARGSGACALSEGASRRGPPPFPNIVSFLSSDPLLVGLYSSQDVQDHPVPLVSLKDSVPEISIGNEFPTRLGQIIYSGSKGISKVFFAYSV